ncbi:MAG: type I secretion system permease/ATPase, partial [Gammaproteobacteria bacterium]|nr:type I secretion system permease/ATPase [Gammaproteobacteria bacterium]
MVAIATQSTVNASHTGGVNPDLKRGHDDPLLDCLALLTRLHGRPMSARALAAGMPLVDHRFTPSLLIRAAERQGYSARVLKRPVARISNMVLPALLLLHDAGACVLTRLDRGSRSAEVLFSETGIGSKQISLDELNGRYSGYCIFVQPRPRTDDRANEERPRPPRFWFWGTLWRFKRYYFEAMVAAALINILALATSLFIMNVYDRVVPNNAVETLLVLAGGTLMAVGFEFLARTMRS